jgi:hypothetical protein
MEVEIYGVHVGGEGDLGYGVFFTQARRREIAAMMAEEEWLDCVPQKLFVNSIKHANSLLASLI